MKLYNIVIVIKVYFVENLQIRGNVIPSIFHYLHPCMRKSQANKINHFLMQFRHRDPYIQVTPAYNSREVVDAVSQFWPYRRVEYMYMHQETGDQPIPRCAIILFLAHYMHVIIIPNTSPHPQTSTMTIDFKSHHMLKLLA